MGKVCMYRVWAISVLFIDRVTGNWIVKGIANSINYMGILANFISYPFCYFNLW